MTARSRNQRRALRRLAAEAARQNAPVAFSVVDVNTGRILRTGTVPFRDVAAQATIGTEIVFEGELDTRKHLDLETLASGQVDTIDAPGNGNSSK